MAEIRVLIADDHAVVRDGLSLVLSQLDGFDVVGEAATGDEAVKQAVILKPDVILMDVQMPGLDGFGVLEALDGETLPQIVFVTAYDEHAARAFEAHAPTYLLKPFDDVRFAEVARRAWRRATGGGRK